MIRLAPGLALPLELVTESVAILAVKRAGKSHTAKRLTEELHRAGQQVVVIDPKGDWWGLRSSADGRAPGLPVVILGGEHGDVPLEPGAGELVGKLIVEQRVSLVVDLSELRKHQVATFMTALLETLYRLKAKDEFRTPMMLVVDEADAIAPQRPMKGEERMLGAAEDIVRRGGQRGIGITLVSQRAAVLNKNVLTQCGVLILLRTTGSQERQQAAREALDRINEIARAALAAAVPPAGAGERERTLEDATRLVESFKERGILDRGTAADLADGIRALAASPRPAGAGERERVEEREAIRRAE